MSQESIARKEYNVVVKHKIGGILLVSLLLGSFCVFYIRENTRGQDVTHHDAYRIVVEAGMESRIVADRTGRIIICSPTAARICGYSAADLEGRMIDEIVPENMKQQHSRAFTEAMHKDAPLREVQITRCHLLKKDGTTIFVEVIIRVVEDSEMGRLAVVTITPVEAIKFVPPVEEIVPTVTGERGSSYKQASWITERNKL